LIRLKSKGFFSRVFWLDPGGGGASPFYDSFSAAGQTYFADIPGAKEEEYELNPVADVQFQVFLSKDNGPAAGGINHDVTIYGGKWWGYQYTAMNVPEGGTPLGWLLTTGLTLGVLVLSARRQAIHSAPCRGTWT
jgi:hypothetical protein